MGNERREPGNSGIDNLHYLAHYQAAEAKLLRCEALLALVAPDGATATATQKARLLKEVLRVSARRDADRGVALAREALKANRKLAESRTFPCAAVGELFGLLDSDEVLEVARARKLDSSFIGKLTTRLEPKRRRQARVSVWMGTENAKYYAGREAESELLNVFLSLLLDEVESGAFRKQQTALLAGVSEVVSISPTRQAPVPQPAAAPSEETDRSPGRMRWMWPAAIVVVVAFAAFVTIYIATRPSDACVPDDPACVPYSIQVETDLDRIAPGIPVGAYLFKPGAFASATKKPSCGDGYRTQEWARQHGGVPAGLQYVRVSITAKDKPILINFAEVEATYMTNHLGDVANCLDGTQLDVRHLEVDTDREVTMFYAKFDPQEGLVSEALALHIAPGESEVLIVSAKATTKDASWHLKLGMDVGGERTEHVVLDKNGRDFQLAASEYTQRTTYRETSPYKWEVLTW